VRFTDHARDRLSRRGLSEDIISQVLSRPAETIATRGNRRASYRQISGKYIVVIHEKEDGDDVVITAMTVDQRRLARFGFTQVR
jgi:hypothetical protein